MNGPLTDDDVAALSKLGTCTGDQLRALADEVIRNRRAMRKDSRRAEQVKKCRWVMENALAKIEALELLVGDETKADVIAEAP